MDKIPVLRDDERHLDPLTGLTECPWCGARPGEVYFDCVHDAISELLRRECDQMVALLAKGCAPARDWHRRMTEGPECRLIGECTPGDVAMVAGLHWAKRLEQERSGERVVGVAAVGIGLLILFLVANLIARVA